MKTLEEALIVLKDNIKGQIKIEDLVWESKRSKIYNTKIDGKDFILKLKNRKSWGCRKDLLEHLYNSNILVPRILFESEGIVLKERIKGISLKDYQQSISNNNYFSKNLNSEEECMCSDFGKYLNGFHNNSKKFVNEYEVLKLVKQHENCISYVINLLKVKPSLNIPEDNLDYLGIFLNKEMNFFIKNKNLISIAHGDFHNSRNIMVKKSVKWEFNSVIDFDTLDVNFIAKDIIQILLYILNNTKIGIKSFLNSYLSEMSLESVNDTIRNLHYFYIIETMLKIRDLYLVCEHYDIERTRLLENNKQSELEYLNLKIAGTESELNKCIENLIDITDFIKFNKLNILISEKLNLGKFTYM